MLPFLSNILFVNPYILLGLLSLPILWFLLRVTPPSPQQISFPATRFLAGLIPETMTPSKTPWWLLLLRLLIAALLIFALSQPVYNPSATIEGRGNLRIVINDDWAAAQNWELITKAAADILAQAERDRRSIELITTAARPEDQRENHIRALSATQALQTLRALKPKPWFNDYPAVIRELERSERGQRSDNTGTGVTSAENTIFFSSGLDDENLSAFLTALTRTGRGNFQFYRLESESLPLALQEPESVGIDPKIAVLTSPALPAAIPIAAQARTQDGRILANSTIQSQPATTLYEVGFDVPELLRNEIGQFSVAGRRSAASVYMVDEQFRKRSVGIAGDELNSDTPAALTQSVTYIRRALEPYAQLHFGTVQALLEVNPAVIILPDIGALPSDTLNALEKWIQKGGLLLRFAGPNMTQSLHTPYLVPVPLRTTERSLDGALSWETPLKLSPFAPESPFFGMDIPPDITVSQQVLAEPVQDIAQKTWASLTDGTPLITADRKGSGLIVLVHTTASPEWSNFALSGLFVRVLRRITDLAGRNVEEIFTENTILDPLYVLDGFGALKQAGNTIKPLKIGTNSDSGSIHINPDTPPGIYGRGGVQKIINLGDHLKELNAVPSLPAPYQVKGYTRDYELDLRPYLLYLALLLLVADWLILLLMGGAMRLAALKGGVGRLKNLGGTVKGGLGAAVLCIGLSLIMSAAPLHSTKAQTAQSLSGNTALEDRMKYADDLYLAYIKTGDSSIDSVTQQGLEILATILTMRTSAEPAGVVGLTPDSDILSFFPILYWPITPSAEPLSAAAAHNIQHYLNHGGTILFDTRDQNFSAGRIGGSPNAQALREIVANLNIPPLRPVPKDHVLTRAFYLLDSFPGKYTGGTLWVEADSLEGRDGVSSVLIGSHDWAASWADNMRGGTRNLYGANRQQEHALRFGVNVIMYALTGNYKSDQVHIPHILERLGQ
ncbi:MAG: DUF4159 domain-containing protein [Alphaproteobacteria bacterium]